MKRRGANDPDPLGGGREAQPVWVEPLERVRTALDAGTAGGEQPVATAPDAATACCARAHGRLLRAIEGRATPDEDTAAGLVEAASELLASVAEVLRQGRDGEDQRDAVLETLAGCLRGDEADILAGEGGCAVTTRDAQPPAARTRKALVRLRASTSGGHGDLLSLQVAAAKLAALLLRTAGNLPRAAEPVAQDAALPAPPLRAIAFEIAARAEQVQLAGAHADLCAGALCAALRLGISAPRSREPARMRDAWLALAAHEHIAISALDAEMTEPAYAHRFPTVTDATVEGATNVLHAGRLLQRPGAFRHRRAWATHAVALTHATEAYARGLRGDGEEFGRAQLIVLTRLVRAAAAIALLDMLRRDGRVTV